MTGNPHPCPCNCKAGWATYSGHRLDCPRNAYAGSVRDRIEREDREDRDEARRGRWVAGTFIHADDLPTWSEL